ncbi:MAG: SHOCT domain-containing protein [Desulfobacteria bacterium]
MMMPMFGCGTNLGSMGWWGGPLFMLMHLLFWGAIIFGIVWAIRRILPAVATTGPRLAEAEEILKRRYASGEITSEEFAQKKKDLGIPG